MKMCNSTSGQLHISNKCVLSINESIFAVQEYEGDGIDWTKVEFIDNQECLNLIEKVSFVACHLTHLVFPPYGKGLYNALLQTMTLRFFLTCFRKPFRTSFAETHWFGIAIK